MGKRYRCNYCGLISDEPFILNDDPSARGVELPPGAYQMETCGNCGSDDLEIGSACLAAHCSNTAFGEEELCEKCKTEIWRRMDEAAQNILVDMAHGERSISAIKTEIKNYKTYDPDQDFPRFNYGE